MSVFQGQKILVVEDNLISYKLIEAHLQRRNLQLLHALDGFEAIRIFKSEEVIDMIIMDVQLPGMSGLEVTRLIREIDTEVPIVAATANVSQDDELQCLGAGCSHFLAKPMNFPDLFSILEEQFHR